MWRERAHHRGIPRRVWNAISVEVRFGKMLGRDLVHYAQDTMTTASYLDQCGRVLELCTAELASAMA